jgi:hypothetical protein
MRQDIFTTADFLLPFDSAPRDWAVIACDQHSSERDYWERVRENVGTAPSTLNMILPEAYLGDIAPNEAALGIHAAMDAYLDQGLLREFPDSFIYVERTLRGGQVRRGLVGVVDLDEYVFAGGEGAITASELTILDRLPPRVTIRRGARLELSHVMALIDDRDCTVIEPLATLSDKLPPLYDFDLMEGGGHIRGVRIHGSIADGIKERMHSLREKCGTLMLIGDGNHSLAAAKSFWDEIKQNMSEGQRETHPARMAMVEVNNLYDHSISFEPIHRVVFGVDAEAFKKAFEAAMPRGKDYELHWLHGGHSGIVGISADGYIDVIAKVQSFLDGYAASTGCGIDYIHGEDAVRRLTRESGRVGVILPAMDKSELFETVRSKGVFPRKSFSIGHAEDKRYYLECRKIAL